jgi:hypothetical protein
MKRYLSIVLALVACGGDKSQPAPRSAQMAAPADTATQSHVFVFDDDSVKVSVGVKIVPETVFVTDTVILPPDTTPKPPVDSTVKGAAPSQLHNHRIPPFTGSIEGSKDPKRFYEQVQWAARNNLRVKFNIPGGGHNNYLKLQCPRNKPTCANSEKRLAFSYEMWRDTLKKYDTPQTRDTIKKYQKFIAMWDVMDEPHVHGGDDGTGTIIGNTWGPEGWLKKINVDSLCREAKRVTGNLVPVSVSHSWHIFDSASSYRVCDLNQNQYSDRYSKFFGNVQTWVNGAVRHAKRQNMDFSMSINWINGGTQDLDGTWDCKTQGGVKGQRQPNCQPTRNQLVGWTRPLATLACGPLYLWKWDSTTVVRQTTTSKMMADTLKTLPYRACKKRGQ